MSAKGYFIPEGVDFQKESFDIGTGFRKAKIEVPHLNRKLAEKTIEKIELAREYLLRTPIKEIAKVIDTASLNLSDRGYHLRREAEYLMPITTGLSPQMLSLALDGLTRTFNEDNIMGMLYSEFGNPEYLDGFRKSNAGKSRAYGKDLIVNVFGSGGVPGLQALGIVNGLLIKSPVFSKPDSGEPMLPAIYSMAIADVDPKIAEAIACIPWKGGDPEYAEVEAYVFGERGKRDAVIVYGSSETIKDIRKKAVNSDCTFIAYPPRISFEIIGREKLTRANVQGLAQRTAYDVCMHDQKACFSPQKIYLEEGGEVSPEEFAGFLAEKMDEMGKEYPVGELTDYAKTRKNEAQRTYIMQEVLGNARLLKPEGGLVIFDRNRAVETPITYRTVFVMPVSDLSEVPELVKPFKDDIQTVGIEADERRFEEYSNIFSSIGDTSRITTPGKMYTFPLSMHHDGRGNYDGLIRWVDRIE